MKFSTLKFRLLNQDAPAGGAPAAPAAPAPAPAAGGAPSGAPAAPAPTGDTGGGALPPSPTSLPDPFKEPDAWDAAFSNLSEDEKYAVLNERKENPFQQEEETPEPKEGDTPAPPADEKAPPAPVDVDAPIDDATFDALPPNVQKFLADKEAFEESVSEYKNFLNPEFQADLNEILSHPVIAQVVQELKGGDQGINSYLKARLDPDTILQNIEGKHDLRGLDFELDPVKSRESLRAIIADAVDGTRSAIMIESKVQYERAQEDARRAKLLDQGIFDISAKVAALKSDKPIGSPEHPIQPFREKLISDLKSGRVSWDFVEETGVEGLYSAFAARNAGGLQSLIEKPAANLRERFIRNLQKAGTRSAVTSMGMPAGSEQSSNVRMGVDASRYLNDEVYRDNMDNRALEAKHSGDSNLYNELMHLNSKGKWR